MSDDMIDTTAAAPILGVTTRRAALAIIDRAGLPKEYRKYGNVFVSRHDVERLASERSAKGITGRRGWQPGRSRKKVAA